MTKKFTLVKTEILSGTITVLVLLVLFWVTTTLSQEEAVFYIDQAGIFGPLIFIVLTLATYIFAPVGSAPIVYAGYFAFGRNVVFLTALVSYLSFALNFWIARRWGKPVVERLIGVKRTERINMFIKNHGLWTLFFLRAFQSGLGDYISYIYGLTSIHFTAYFLVSVAASVPGIVILYVLSHITNDPLMFTIASWIIGVALSGLYLIFQVAIQEYKKMKARRLKLERNEYVR